MTDSPFYDVLDVALARLAAGERLRDILADYPEETAVLQGLLHARQALAHAEPVVMPAANAMNADRAAFLSKLAASSVPTRYARKVPAWRLWLNSLATFVLLPYTHLQDTLKEISTKRSQPTMLAMRMMLALILLLGAGTGTAVASANSLPDSPLYPIKIGIEEVRVNLTHDPVEQARLQIELAQRRIQEIQQLALNGSVPDEAIQKRLQTHLQTALQLTANAPEAEMAGLLNQARLMIQGAAPGLVQAQQQVHSGAQTALGEAYQLMHRIGQEIDDALQNPQTFRWRYMHNRPADLPTPPDVDPPGGPHAGGVITHTMPVTHTWPITTPVQAGPGYGPGEPGGNPESPNGPNTQNPPQYGPGEPSGPGAGATPQAGNGLGQQNDPHNNSRPDNGQNGSTGQGGNGNGGNNGGDTNGGTDSGSSGTDSGGSGSGGGNGGH